MGCTSTDTDGDGDLDLFVSGVGGYRFYRNDGGKFVDVSAEAGLVPPARGRTSEGAEHGCFATSAAFLDYDGDGRPDLFVCHYVRWSEETDVWSTMDGKTKSYAIPTQYQGESCRLWRNARRRQVRGRDRQGAASGTTKARASASACSTSRTTGGPTSRSRTTRSRTTSTGTTRTGRSPTSALDCGDRLRPRRARARRHGHRLRRRVRATASSRSRSATSAASRCRSSSSFRASRGIMVNKADQYGVAVVTHPMLTFGVLFLDADLDGCEDLLLANGHIEPTIQSVHKETPYAQPMQLLRNVKGRRFVDVSKSRRRATSRSRGSAAALAYADVDGDGDLDLVR